MRRRYDSYKDSGIEWMNEIPSKWKRSRIRMVGELYGGLTGKKGDDFNNDNNLTNRPFIPFTNIFNNTYISKDHFQLVNIEDGENQNRVLKNDLFFLMSSESYEDLGKCSILLEDVEELYLNSFCKGYRVKDSSVYPLFLNYQLLGSLHKEMISIEGNGFTRINLRQDRLLDVPVFIPPLSEQQQIVSFLDNKTSLIDSLIEKTQRKIELLKEKRTSIINEVVTKGLNPNVEMKDSGVEWIGEIPNHWTIQPIKYLSSPEKDSIVDGPFGSSINVNEDYGDFEIPVIRTVNITDKGFNSDDLRFMRVEKYLELKRHNVIPNDILFSKVGTIGNVCLFPHGFEKGILSTTGSCRIRVDVKKVDRKWMVYTLLKHKPQFIFLSGQNVQPFLNMTTIKDVKLEVPPIREQTQIVDYLDEQTQKIDRTISIEEKRIELLKEYRQSLISEVVTGKLKVTTDE